MPTKKKSKRVITTIRKYAKNHGIDTYWLDPENLDTPLDRSIIGNMAIRSAHKKGMADCKRHVLDHLGFK